MLNAKVKGERVGEIQFVEVGVGPIVENLLPATVRRMIAVLDALPLGHVMKTSDLAEAVGRPEIAEVTTHKALRDYRAMKSTASGTRWGNKETIAAYRKRFNVP